MSTQESAVVTVNDIELEEGDTLWHYAALRTYQQTLGEQDPNDVQREIADALAAQYPDAVDGESADAVYTTISDDPGAYDDTELIRYHAMEVRDIDRARGQTIITLMD